MRFVGTTLYKHFFVSTMGILLDKFKHFSSINLVGQVPSR